MTLYSSAISAGNLTKIRSNNNYHAIQYALVVPNDVVVQFQPFANPDTVFAEIQVGTVASGDMADVQEAQTVIFSTSTDYVATETFRTYVRKVDGTVSLYVGQNSQALTTSQYVTVVDTYEIHEKPRRSEALLDWDVTYRKLLPIETAIPSAVVVSNGGTSYQPPTACVVMDADSSSIASYTWTSSNSNDSFDDTAIAQPTITLEAGAFRWLRVTFTDDTGLSNFRVFPCWTVDRDYGSVVAGGWGREDGTLASVRYDAELGFTCDLQAFSGITSLLNRTLVVVASDEWYNETRGEIRTNINFVGYLRSENTDTRGDSQYGKISEATFTLEGFGHQFARHNIDSALIQRSSSPDEWDKIKNPTPARMATYRLTEYSTASNLCAISIPSDDTDFVGDDLILDNDTLLDDIRFITEVINAELQFDIDGKLNICRNLNFLDDTARDAATVIATLSPSDFTGRYTIDLEYGYTTSNIEMKGGAFDSTNAIYDVYEASAPAGIRYSEGDPLEIANQVLTTDAAAADALDEIEQRAANWLAYNNPTYLLSVTLKDEWWFLVPDIGSWFKFDIAATDTVRGRTFDTNDRWQLIQISVSTNNSTGRRVVDATFRLETSSTDAAVRSAPSIYNDDADYGYVPGVQPPFSYDLDLSDDIHYDDLSSEPPSNPNPVPSECQLGGLRPKSGNLYITDAVGTLTVNCRVRGSGLLKDNSALDYDFITSNEGFTARAGTGGTYTAGFGWSGVAANAGLTKRIWIEKTISATTIYSGTMVCNSNLFSYESIDTDMRLFLTNSGGDTIVIQADPVQGTGRVTYTFEQTIEDVTKISYRWDVFNAASVVVGNMFLETLTLSTGSIQGDSFYYSNDGLAWQAYDVGDGLYIEGSQPNIPPYNPQHEYFLPSVTVAGLATITYEFKAGSFTRSEFSNWNIQCITCENL